MSPFLADLFAFVLFALIGGASTGLFGAWASVQLLEWLDR